jgi:hypothetical protein
MNSSQSYSEPPVERAPDTRKQLAAELKVSEHKVQQALNAQKADPELLKEVSQGRVSLKAASKRAAAARPKAKSKNSVKPAAATITPAPPENVLRQKIDAVRALEKQWATAMLELAREMHAARQPHASDKAFRYWVIEHELDEFGGGDHAALVTMGGNPKLSADSFLDTDSRLPHLILQKLQSIFPAFHGHAAITTEPAPAPPEPLPPPAPPPAPPQIETRPAARAPAVKRKGRMSDEEITRRNCQALRRAVESAIARENEREKREGKR